MSETREVDFGCLPLIAAAMLLGAVLAIGQRLTDIDRNTERIASALEARNAADTVAAPSTGGTDDR